MMILSNAAYAEWSGNVSARVEIFKNEPINDDQKRGYASLSMTPKYSMIWDDNRQLFGLEVFARVNQHVPNSADIRELSWIYTASEWEFRAGIRKVFWGVTESQHLVDIINQTDFTESFDGEEKLGQPMLNLAIIRDWGTVDLFVLPWFRERRFPHTDARLGFPLPIASQARFESKQAEKHIDYAARWSHYVGDWDIGLSHFYGTSREPKLVASAASGKLDPVYDLIHQTGLDIQATLENWLWKLEAIRRDGEDEDYFAATAGFEYSFFDVKGSGADIGIVTEYLYDERGREAPTPFQNDTMLGIRVALNDEQSTDALVGAIVDNDGNGTVLSLEANRRIGQNFKLTINGYLFTHTEPDDPIHNYANEDYVKIDLGYYF